MADDLSTYWKDLPSRETPLDARTLNAWGGLVEEQVGAAQAAASQVADIKADIDGELSTLKYEHPENFAVGYDWNNVTKPGAYPIWSATNAPTSPAETWALFVGRTPTNGNVLQIAWSWTTPGRIAIRRRNSGALGAWTVSSAASTLAAAKDYADQLVGSIPPPSTAAGVGAHEHISRLSHLRARVGTPRTGGRAAVTLVCDHGTNNFASIVLPALRARGLRCTLALNSQMYASDHTHAAHEDQTSWSQIKGWADVDGIEIANHGRTHRDATGEAAIRLEIAGGREELEDNLPGVPIDTWVQIGTTGNGTKWDGFDDGIALDRYFTTYAGRVIIDSHALVMGQVPHGGVPNRVYPLDGHPPLGASGYWLDAGPSGIDAAKAKIDEAVSVGGGVILRLHPYLLDWPNQISSAHLVAFLDYLAARRDAGDLDVLPYREWALAAH